jgi:hypothetical protein
MASICFSPPEISSPRLLRFAGRDLREPEVLRDGQVGEDAALFGDERNARARDRHHIAAGEFGVAEFDAAAARAHPAHDRLQRRGFAGAVAAEQRDGFALRDLQGNGPQDVALAVVAFESLDAQERSGGGDHGSAPSAWPPR